MEQYASIPRAFVAFRNRTFALFKGLCEKKQYLLYCGSETEMLEAALSGRF